VDRQQEAIVTTAESCLGQTEIKGNQGFISKWFDKAMRAVGFRNGWAWCNIFIEYVYKEAYPNRPELLKSITPSTYRSFNALMIDPNYEFSMKPKVGDMVYWFKYKNGKHYKRQGHCGIVVALPTDGYSYKFKYIDTKGNEKEALVGGIVSKKSILSIDGNTNFKGAREGRIVSPKERKLNSKAEDSLRYMGCFRVK
jgi:hypothetical protein